MNLLKSETARNISKLTIGSVIAQSITIGSSFILARMYSPENFASLAIYISILGLFSVFSSFRYEMAIMLPEKNKDSFSLVFLSIIIVVLVSILSLILFVFFNDTLSNLYNNNTILEWILLMPIAVLSIGFYQIFNMTSLRYKNYNLNIIGKISQTFTTAIASIIFFEYFKLGIGLVLGSMCGLIISAIIMTIYFRKSILLHIKDISISNLSEKAKTFKDFPFINAPHAALDTFRDLIIIFMFSSLFNEKDLGFYALAYRVLTAPIGIIGRSIYQVYYKEFTEREHNKIALQPGILNLYKKLTYISLPVFLILIFFSPVIFKTLFGIDWEKSGIISQFLAPMLFLNFLISPVSSITMVKNKLKQAFIISIIHFVFKIMSIYIGYLYDDFMLSIILLSFTSSLVYIYELFWYYRIAKS